MTNAENLIKNYSQICFEKKWNLDLSTYFRLGECSAMVEALRYLPLSPEVRKQMMAISLIKGAMATTAIEGNTLTEDEVRAIHEGRSELPQSRKYQENEVKNVLEALNAIHQDVMDMHTISPVTLDLVKSFNYFVGKGLGEEFASVPGQFRQCEVVVGTYRPPDHRVVKLMMERMCEWIQREFSFRQEQRPDFAMGVIEAIVAHIYLVWIHPFADGNGRTARLLEFYLLLRSGLPDTCAHILSNHYNKTRSEYYRQLDEASRNGGDLTRFIQYAIQGLHDGLIEVLHCAQGFQIVSCWRNYVYDQLDKAKLTGKVRKRYAKLLTSMDIFTEYEKDKILSSKPEVAAMYGMTGASTLDRDLQKLLTLQLLDKHENGKYAVRTSELVENLPLSRPFADD